MSSLAENVLQVCSDLFESFSEALVASSDETKSNNELLLVAARRGDELTNIESLLKSGADSNYASAVHGVTALHLAAQEGHVGIVGTLVNAGGDVNKTRDDETSALQLASERGHDLVVLKLVDSGANVNYGRPGDGETALHAACRRGQSTVAAILINAGCHINSVRRDGWSALQLACRQGHVETVRVLLDGGVNITQANHINRRAVDALYIARSFKQSAIVALLEEKIGEIKVSNETQ